MIGKLTGIIDSLHSESLILDVNGVGYIIYLSIPSLTNVKVGSKVSFFIECQVREDSITLFGFVNENDKKLFNLLKTVQGVGAKLALGIMGVGFNNIVKAIQMEDLKTFQSVSGVGAKVANRVISELKDKIIKIFDKDIYDTNYLENKNKDGLYVLVNEATYALKALGYTVKEAEMAIKNVLDNNNFNNNLEDLIKEALSYFSKNKN